MDVPRAYLQADLQDDNLLSLKLKGCFEDYRCEINPADKPNIRYDSKGRKVIYMRVMGAIYGCIEAALQLYNLFNSTLEKEGFVLNPY